MTSTQPVTIDQQAVLVIRPSVGWRALDIRELWRYRELLFIFAWRDLKVRYRQTILGAVWVLGQPLLTMGLFTLLFNRVARFSSGPIPYPLYVLSGIVLWNFFANAVSRAGNSLIGASFLISKVYFPRLIIPLSNIVVELADMAISALLLVVLMFIYRVAPSWSLGLLPLPLLLAIALGTGAGLWVAALNVEYRDIRVLIPFVLQLGMYAAPIVYPLARVPERYRIYALANPMTGIVEGFRATLFGQAVDLVMLIWPAIGSTVILISGVYYFRRMERQFADIL